MAEAIGHCWALVFQAGPEPSISILDMKRMDCSFAQRATGKAASCARRVSAAVADFDAQQAVVATSSHRLQIWDLRKLGSTPLATSDDGIFGTKSSLLLAEGLGTGDAHIACSDNSGKIRIFDVGGSFSANLAPIHTLVGHCAEVRWASFDWGRIGASLCSDGAALLWDMDPWSEGSGDDREPGSPATNKRIEPRLLGSGGDVSQAMAFQYQNDIDVVSGLTGGRDGNLRVWCVDSDDIKKPEAGHLQGHEDQITVVRADFPKKQAVTGSLDRTLRVWDLDIDFLGCQAVLEGHKSSVRSAAVDFKLGRAFSSGGDPELLLWDLGLTSSGETSPKGGCLGKLPIQSGAAAVREIVANFGLGCAATVSRAGELRLWDLERLESIAHIEGHPGVVYAMQIGNQALPDAGSEQDEAPAREAGDTGLGARRSHAPLITTRMQPLIA
mmetsp:Transcript_98201/g.277716  ORF Transcript_98201/g.277716 Transcript_98201/m.277716 type:complete len:442 (-) Transcript_98201:446-1771(-)